MEYLAIIPARYASTRFPGKPLAMIAGKTMIQRVYEQASLAFQDVYVATDHPGIFDAVTAFGGRVVMTSASHPNGTSRVYEAMQKIEKLRGTFCKYVINVQGDEPLTNPKELEDPSTPKVVCANNGKALYFSRATIPFLRDIPQKNWLEEYSFFKHIGLYGYKRETLAQIAALDSGTLEKAENLEQLRWLENDITIMVRETPYESQSVDRPEDIEELKMDGII
jgi:3-deoxy-manno-octulosonate cytidylyltransferase (CMP-KDO synthetase)